MPRLVRALLVKYLYNWSLRDLEWHLRFNLLVKWFVGYSIFDLGPDHCTLDRFELWVCYQHHRTFFDELLRQIDADFPAERQHAQVGDTYALRANTATESVVQLLRHTCRRLLTAVAKVDAAREAAVRASLDATALFGAKDERSELHLTPAERTARLQTVVRAALACAHLVRTQLELPRHLTPEQRTPILEWLAYLDKIIADEVVVVPTENPATPQVTARPADDKGAYRLGSATDPEGSFDFAQDRLYRVHGDDGAKTDFGYNVQVAVTENFVREVQVDTGAQPDPVAIPAVLKAEKDYHDLVPPKFIYDTAAGQGKTRALVAVATDGHTQLVAPLPPTHTPTGKFTPDRFQLSEDDATLTCPNDQTSSVAYAAGSGDGRTFRFLGFQCAACPLWAQCRTQTPGSKRMRQVFISDYRPEVEAALRYNQTDDFKADMKRRPRVERIIAALVRYNGARQARRRGLFKCDFQAKPALNAAEGMNAVAFNAKKWMRLLRKPARQTASL